ncbi:hypothetical protein ACRE_039180 [Hapsidospora chrysogenum ATCC 11550]|uniref:Uncharacterized protein n=1 Tax=Hapsidospora chrysogenum (strain ATCC 11550 / CBS 779.69 / DSM 880 / IAM 14645 / JCM 23072 / IMI 49137) TaxID=857340 RepID=A0A086T7G5_HAPC1|nr:hypothetical protein ACRE_039180 [Hapsidospora chrysogenum ATCC 11550]
MSGAKESAVGSGDDDDDDDDIQDSHLSPFVSGNGSRWGKLGSGPANLGISGFFWSRTSLQT